MIIRDYREQDWDQVWHLWELCHLPPPPGCSSAGSKPCLGGNSLCLVADTENGIIASATGTWDGERGWICCIAVEPRFRRGNTARRLIEEMESRLRKKGASCVLTFVPRDNSFAQMLFEDAGFGVLGDHIVMGKPLQ
ncbi:MAG: GNAT family N-acetyltransferase [Chloroflexi bacterium]|nr:GNAT family N-acetyltransferase [Chloroflexota bacterium]